MSISTSRSWLWSPNPLPAQAPRPLWLLVLVWLVAFPPTAESQGSNEPVITVNGISFDTWEEYTGSPLFLMAGWRCDAPGPVIGRSVPPVGSTGASDCSYGSSTPSGQYAPTTLYDIPVVVHVLRRTNGTGHISEAVIQSQIDVLNEDFRAVPGTPGGLGGDARIRFHLATVDPSGNPTNGITYTSNDSWFSDDGAYWDTLAWNTNRYMNVYTNEAGGSLGYVPDLPQGGLVGTPADRVVVLHAAFGRNAAIGAPFDQGRTLTHEVGHYLGLFHTFAGGCGNANCYTTGDLLCDTAAEGNPTHGCNPDKQSCGSLDPSDNYMDYGDDGCMTQFTEEQVRRMRCTLESYRPSLFTDVSGSWSDLAGGTTGVAGAPTLSGTGELAPNSTVHLDLVNAPPGATLLAWMGFSANPTPYFGGTLGMFPPDRQFVFAANAGGEWSATTNWPVGFLPQTEVLFQFILADPSSPWGITLSNTVKATTP